MTNNCPQCHRPVPEGIPLEVCPTCLFGDVSNLFDPPETDVQPFALPTLDRLKRTFPEKYQLIETIGRGGMGLVMKAHQIGVATIPVAVKILPRIQTTPERVQRFREEIETLSRLDHANIVEVKDSGQTKDGFFYFVMEYVGGVDLKRYLETHGALEPDAAIELIDQVCSAMEHAHSKGCLHLDIKPANILVSEDLKTVKVGDFGLASFPVPRAKTEEELEADLASRIGYSPCFSAPELRPGTGHAGPASDVFSIGATFYALLTGRPPEELWGSLRLALGPESKRFEPVISKAMQLDPSRRHTSVAELRREIRAQHSDEIAARRRAAAWRVGLAATVCIAVVFAGVSLVQKWRAVGSVARSATESIEKGRRAEALRQLGKLQLSDGWGFKLRQAELEPLVADAAKAVVDAKAILTDHLDWVTIATHLDNGRLLTGSWDRTVRLWSTEVGGSRELFKSEAQISCVDVDPNATVPAIYVADWTGNCHVLGLDGALIATFRHGNARCNWIAHSLDGRRLVTGGDDRKIRVWDAAARTVLLTLPVDPAEGHTNMVKSVQFDPEGKRIVSAGFDGTVRLWDAGSGRLLRNIPHYVSGVNSATFSPDGRFVASGGSDGSVWLWDVSRDVRDAVRKVPAHTGKRVNSVRFDASGKRLLSCGDDNTAKVWDVATGELLLSYEGHRDIVVFATFSPDGEEIVTMSKDKSVHRVPSRLPTFSMSDALKRGSQLPAAKP